jgi:hypothetical protein
MPVFASDTYTDGEVLFAARYGDYKSLRDTGVRLGTSSWEESRVSLADGYLRIHSSSDKKTYLLLPEEIPHTDTYTVVFTFRFSEVAEERGYCGFLLSVVQIGDRIGWQRPLSAGRHGIRPMERCVCFRTGNETFAIHEYTD